MHTLNSTLSFSGSPAIKATSSSAVLGLFVHSQILPGSTNKACDIAGFTSSAIGRAPLHNTASPTGNTDRSTSGALTASYRGHMAKFSSLPGIDSRREPSCFNTSAPLPSPSEHTSGTKPATASRGWAKKPIAPRTTIPQSIRTSSASFMTRSRPRILMPPSYKILRSAVNGSWFLQNHQAGGLARGVLLKADGPRGAPSISPSVPPCVFRTNDNARSCQVANGPSHSFSFLHCLFLFSFLHELLRFQGC